MTKTIKGILFGALVGLVDLVPMIFQDLTLDADLSAFSLWVVSGFLIANTNLKLKSPVKGIIISFLVLLPSAVIIGWQEPFSLIPITVMTLILGSVLGYFVDRGNEKVNS